MKMLYVPLNASEFETLQTIARTERRRPQEQAAVLLARALTHAWSARAFDPPDPSASSSNQPLLVKDACDRDKAEKG